VLLDVITFFRGDTGKVKLYEIRGTISCLSEPPVQRIKASAQVYDLPFTARQLHKY